jgi:hypothetical protein
MPHSPCSGKWALASADRRKCPSSLRWSTQIVPPSWKWICRPAPARARSRRRSAPARAAPPTAGGSRGPRSRPERGAGVSPGGLRGPMSQLNPQSLGTDKKCAVPRRHHTEHREADVSVRPASAQAEHQLACGTSARRFRREYRNSCPPCRHPRRSRPRRSTSFSMRSVRTSFPDFRDGRSASDNGQSPPKKR